jgi:hypothetical protein
MLERIEAFGPAGTGIVEGSLGVDSLEIGPFEPCGVRDGVVQVGSGEIRSLQMGVELSPTQVGAAQVGASEAC